MAITYDCVLSLLCIFGSLMYKTICNLKFLTWFGKLSSKATQTHAHAQTCTFTHTIIGNRCLRMLPHALGQLWTLLCMQRLNESNAHFNWQFSMRWVSGMDGSHKERRKKEKPHSLQAYRDVNTSTSKCSVITSSSHPQMWNPQSTHELQNSFLLFLFLNLLIVRC